MNEPDYEQRGYLNCSFKFFHICNKEALDVPYHYHDFDKIILFLHGNTKYTIEGKEYELKPYDFILVNRYDIHKAIVSSQTNYDRMILYIDHDFLNSFDESGEDGFSLTECFDEAAKRKTYVVRFPANVSSKLYENLNALEEAVTLENESYAGKLLSKTEMIKFMIGINRAAKEEQLAFFPEARYNPKIVEIIEYIGEHLSEDLSIDSIADEFFISKYHMMRMFKADTGYSIHKYISEKRILNARSLILNGETASNACIMCGFMDYSSFCRAFRAQLGILPSELTIK